MRRKDGLSTSNGASAREDTIGARRDEGASPDAFEARGAGRGAACGRDRGRPAVRGPVPRSLARIAAAALATLALAPLQGACAATGTDAVLVVASRDLPWALDPHRAVRRVDFVVAQALFEGLVVADPAGGPPRPGLAESWESSEDGTKIAFRLREAVWSDGTPVTAADVVGSWLRAINPDTASEHARLFVDFVVGADGFSRSGGKGESVGVRAIGDRAVEVELVAPCPWALERMTHAAFLVLPIRSIEKLGGGWDDEGAIVCGGPFVPRESVEDERLVLARNPRYWDAANVALERVEIARIRDDRAILEAWRAGEADWVLEPPDSAVAETVRAEEPGVAWLALDTTKPPLADLRVRKALALAVDRAALAPLLGPDAVPTATLLLRAASPSPPDVAAARAYLADAGFPGGAGLPALRLVLPQSSARGLRVAEALRDSWKAALGIDVVLAPMELKEALAARRDKRAFDLALAGRIADRLDPDAMLAPFASNHPLHEGHWSSAAYDGLAARASALCGEPRAEAWLEAEDLLLRAEAAVIPLWRFVAVALFRADRWEGWKPNPLDRHPLKFVVPKRGE